MTALTQLTIINVDYWRGCAEIEYFLAVLADPSDPERRARLDAAVAERGKQAGAELGENPAGAVTQLAERVVTLVRARAADTPVATPAGTMTLSTYLPTRSFELTVHTLDLTRAIDLPTPVVLGPAVLAACELAGRSTQGSTRTMPRRSLASGWR